MSEGVLITGAWFWNKGAEAMIRSVQQGILRHLPEAVPLLHAFRDASPTDERLRGLKPWSVPVGRRLQLGWLCRSGLVSGPLRPRLRRQLGVTAVIDVSGYKFGDAWQRPLNWSGRKFVSSAKQALLGALVGDNWAIYHALSLPVFHLPQAWGPFEYAQSRQMAERILRGASRVWARDEVSYDWLRRLSAFSEEKVARASDIAFSFSGAEPAVGQSLLATLGVRLGERPLIGIVPNMRVYERAEGHGADNAYVRRLLTIMRWLIAERQCQVVLMPHELTPPELGRDDRYLCRLLAEASGVTDQVWAATGEYSAEELKAMIGHTELLVSSRFHSLVAALSLRRPVVALAWSHKYHELLGGVGLGEFVASHETEPQALLTLCDQALASRAAMTNLLEQHVPAHEASAAAVLAEVTEMIRNVL